MNWFYDQYWIFIFSAQCQITLPLVIFYCEYIMWNIYDIA